MGYDSIIFASAKPAIRLEHLEQAHKLFRASVVYRNQITPELNDSGALDLEATIRLEEAYIHPGHQWFAERWGPLFGASPSSPALLTPERYLDSLYGEGSRLLFSYEEAPEKLFPEVLTPAESLPAGYCFFSPHPIAPAWEKPVRYKKLPDYQTHVQRWRYLWVPLGTVYEAERLFDEVMSGEIKPAAAFVRTDDYGDEEPCLLMPCDFPTYEEAKKAVLEALPEDLVDDPDQCNDDTLTDLVPLPWRQDEYRLVYFNPPLSTP